MIVFKPILALQVNTDNNFKKKNNNNNGEGVLALIMV